MSDLVSYGGERRVDRRRPTIPLSEHPMIYARAEPLHPLWMRGDLSDSGGGSGGLGRQRLPRRTVLRQPAAVQAEVVLANVALLLGCTFSMPGSGSAILLLSVALINGCFLLVVVTMGGGSRSRKGALSRQSTVAVLASIVSVVVEGMVLSLADARVTAVALTLLAALPLASLALAIVGTNRSPGAADQPPQLRGPGGLSSATYRIGH